ncbi:MAG: carboxypeptidase-like regulatory domain-containing protein [Gemmataceae bacterium]
MHLSPRVTLILLLALLTGLALLALPASKASPLEGCVRDHDGPLAGARVQYQGETMHTVTDADGRFRLPRKSPSRRAMAWKQGYFIAQAVSMRNCSLTGGQGSAIMPFARRRDPAKGGGT